ncbi:heterokaryon incompatibility protein-domain-containing protein [Phyllosticta citribraziliensis]|uniref:Heterokaryon incompatibility protein-domain-containing protein n=1 Tax=Phyllosticta citribraziliensis TaxID=989973 RepID=A0ABR1LP57_9PEZI
MGPRPSQFKYDALPSPSSIRLVTILPPGDGDTPICGNAIIKCRLETVDLNDTPVYDALSYTWGSPWLPGMGQDKKVREYSLENNWPISVNGALKTVTKNLYEGLLRLRHHVFDAEEEEAVKGEGGLQFQCDIVGDVDQRFQPFHKTPLIQAAELGSHVVVKQLLKRGADVRAQDRFGESALHYAAENGHLFCVKLLVWAGSNCKLLDKKNRTPLDCCEQRKRGDFEQVATFLKAPTAHHAGCEPREARFLPVRIWIDALCINQDDTPEKMAQVEMMKRIYASAQSTIVWLGVEDQATSAAVEALDILLNYPHLVGLIPPRYNSSTAILREAIDAPYSKLLRRRFEALNYLIKRAWFSRIWIIQEVILARNVTVLCGECILPWKAIRLRGKHHIALVDAKGPGALEFLMFRSKSKRVLGALELFDVALDRQCSLSSLLVLTESFSAKDPRDKFFALLSIARESNSGNVVAVDYQTPPRNFFMLMAYDLISCRGVFSKEDAEDECSFSQVLEGLSFDCWPPRSQNNPLGLPSWVPDFRRTWCAPRERLFQRRFAACTSIPAVIRELPQKERLGLVGFKFDEIEAVAPRVDQPVCRRGSCDYMLLWPPCQCQAKWRKSLPLWLKFASSLNSSYPSGGALFKALLHTLMGGSRDYLGTGFQDAEKKAVDSLKILLDAKSFEQCMPLVRAMNNGDLPGVRENGNFAETVRMPFYCNRRSLYKTRQGYLGLGRREVEPGDEVWLLAGARTPFVVKRLKPDECENVLEFRGETYIHGIMHGEAVEGREGDMTELELA